MAARIVEVLVYTIQAYTHIHNHSSDFGSLCGCHVPHCTTTVTFPDGGWVPMPYVIISKGEIDPLPQVRGKSALPRPVLCMSSSEQPCVHIRIEVRVLGAVSMGQAVAEWNRLNSLVGLVVEFIDFGPWLNKFGENVTMSFNTTTTNIAIQP